MNSNWLWDRNISSAAAKKIMKDTGTKEFVPLAALLLSRNNDSKDVFRHYLKPLVFCKQWAAIKRRMRKDKWSEPRIVFWQAIYENLSDRYRKKGIVFRGEMSQAKEPLCYATGKQISGIRREQGLSQKEMAKKIGISQQLISRIEKGRENASVSTLANMARALNKKLEINFI
jgi:DNA-binding XRE family transcriptional regulator